MKRRKFVVLSAIGTASLSLSSLNCTNPTTELLKLLSVPDMLSHLCDKKTIEEIGRFYGSKNAGEYKEAVLQKLMQDDEGKVISVNTPTETIHFELIKKVHSDFAAGRTTVANVWILFVTEAPHCALLSLIPS